MTTRYPSTKLQRSEIIRERVKDELGRLGENRSGKRRVDARFMFVTQAIRIGRENGMRLWRDENTTAHMETIALQSLQVLLEERGSHRTRKDGTRIWDTGRNDHWVLDLWEAALDYYSGRNHSENPPRPESPDDAGIQVVAPPPVDVSGIKIIEAYLAKDDDGIIAIAADVDRLVKEWSK